MSDIQLHYNNLSPYLLRKYGCRVFKICLDGGFTCPNRDGKKGVGGCIFCGERGAGEHLRVSSVSEQIAAYFKRARKAEKFIAYFQNFTGTYAPIAELKEKYDEALSDPRICVLSVGTRPDCVDEEVCELLASYLPRADVWVELGLQTASNATAALCHRGYETEIFLNAVNLLKKYHLNVIVHIMLGLPNETEKDWIATAKLVDSVKPFGVKIHSTYVIEGTQLERMYRRGEYTPLTVEAYAAGACKVLRHLSSDILVHKITGDAPKDRLIAPLWNADKNGILDALHEEMERENAYQGDLLIKNRPV